MTFSRVLLVNYYLLIRGQRDVVLQKNKAMDVLEKRGEKRHFYLESKEITEISGTDKEQRKLGRFNTQRTYRRKKEQRKTAVKLPTKIVKMDHSTRSRRGSKNNIPKWVN